ncbi:MAG: methylmalonyl-CoA mutase family protein [Prevotellaceae bacterium]|jgi:methylmalonyl-CoA mutase|nr:methylmalonyl-CoA mutase family protein [Prevotellaceae bacterium]
MIQKLFTEFPPVTAEQWDEVIIKDLKGADYNKKLVWKTYEGFNVRPYYSSINLKDLQHLKYAAGVFPFVRGTHNDNNWKITQTIFPDNRGVKTDNALILNTLMKGVDSIIYKVKSNGLSDQDFDILLKDIALPYIEFSFQTCCTDALKTLKQLVAKVKSEGWEVDKIQGYVNFDPLRRLTMFGSFITKTEREIFEVIKSLIKTSEALPNYRVIGVSPFIYQNAGSTIVQELALGLAMGSEYLAQLTDLGLEINEITNRMQFIFSVSSNYFMEIAKFRAARMLWAEIVKTYGGSDCAAKLKIHAKTSEWNQTVYDPYVNMLRNTTEAMSAALAGVDLLEVTPFDTPYASHNEFSRRIARNTQLLLKEESYFDRVTDPSAGSYYIETLTASIAAEAWKLFNEIERKGGYIAALQEGFIQNLIKTSAQNKDNNIATRREILLGTNQYPNFTEKLNKEVLETRNNTQSIQNVQNSACCSEYSDKLTVEPIKVYRGAAAFEELRMRTEKSGNVPIAFMLTFGNLAMCRARAQFSCNFFACAGFEVVDNNRFANPEEGVDAAVEAGAKIVVACSSDDEYAENVPVIYEKLAGKAIVVVAGDPACRAELEAKSIKHFINVKSNVLETLKEYQKELGI